MICSNFAVLASYRVFLLLVFCKGVYFCISSDTFLPNIFCKSVYVYILSDTFLLDILTNLGRIAKYEKMSQNIKRYLEEECLIIYLVCIFVNFNLKAMLPDAIGIQLETGLTSLTVKVVFQKQIILIYL